MRLNSYTNSKLPARPKVWHNENCMWVSVPKNANMMMRNLCQQTHMTPKTIGSDTAIAAKEIICIIRDPGSRILSGLIECQKRSTNTQLKNKTIPELLQLLLDDIQLFDEHLEPQIFYLQNFTFTHILKFEILKQELLTTQHFSQYFTLVDKLVKEDLLSSSRKIKNLNNVVHSNQNLIDLCVKKYYFLDQKLWMSPEKFTGTIIPTPENLNEQPAAT